MRKAEKKQDWDAGSIRALRDHLDLTQVELAGQMGIRQQTVSEWEQGDYAPRGASVKLLSIIADRSGFKYKA
ncbi:MAG: helix-turn-helix domain-containing protein [Dehalococcoidia bacterium]|nr:helix-turn-helix domain-containing protein [Dehalococcoidia bacterium]